MVAAPTAVAARDVDFESTKQKSVIRTVVSLKESLDKSCIVRSNTVEKALKIGRPFHFKTRLMHTT